VRLVGLLIRQLTIGMRCAGTRRTRPTLRSGYGCSAAASAASQNNSNSYQASNRRQDGRPRFWDGREIERRGLTQRRCSLRREDCARAGRVAYHQARSGRRILHSVRASMAAHPSKAQSKGKGLDLGAVHAFESAMDTQSPNPTSISRNEV